MKKYRLPRKLKKKINKLNDNFFVRVLNCLSIEQKPNETEKEFNDRIRKYMLGK